MVLPFPTSSLTQFAPGTGRLAAVPALVAIPLLFVFPAVGIGLLVLAGVIVWFHRDPDRTAPDSGVVAPADGRVSVIREDEGRVRVGVFMNVTDVHVNRAPLAGIVQSVEHRPGANRPAFSKDSERNERVRIECGAFDVVLIAGWFARRIHPYVETGARIERGQRIGHVSFGSRADVMLPAAYGLDDLTVETGDQVRAGETVIAHAP